MKLFPALRAAGLAGLVVTLSVSRLMAQDVTVTDPAWFDAKNPPADTLPKFKRAPSGDYPYELKTQPGYLIAMRYIAEDGKSTRHSDWASHPFFKDDAQWEGGVKFLPGQKDGTPVGASIWYALLFNPKTASKNGANADVRLLAVAPVIVPKERLSKVPGVKNGHLAVWTRVKVDVTGAASLVSFDVAAQESFRDVIEATLPAWRFAPARKEGQAVEAEVAVAFVITRMPSLPAALKPDKKPRVRSQVPPVYPRSLRGESGEVTVRFTVDENGAVKNPVVVKTNHPAFDQPALDAISRWTYKPAEKDGKPTAIQMQQMIIFNYPGGRSTSGAVTLSEQSEKQQQKLPEALRYDVPPKVKGLLYPSYPFDLLIAKTKGKAEVAFMVDAEGRVSGVKVLSADKPEFGESLAASVAAFEFVPASREGKPVATIFRLEHEFDPSGWNGRPSQEDVWLAAKVRSHPELILKPDSLDAPLKPVFRRTPVFPQMATVAEGEAVIEMIIDTDGRARLPKIIKATEPILGYAAAQAASEWQFEVPKVKGKATAIRARVPFKFTAPKPKEPQQTAREESAPVDSTK